MAPAIVGALLARLSTSASDAAAAAPDPRALGPRAAQALLLARDDDPANKVDPHHGVTNPTDLNNPALFVLFGLIGAAFVVTGIWFFFWAKNGGFHFKETDWEEYKSTVLRRKGPNGTLLSGATPSTNLGGGSIYKDMDDGSTEDAATTVVSATTGITGGVSDVLGRDRRRKRREQKERDRDRRREEKAEKKAKLTKKRDKAGTRKVNADGVLVDEYAEAEAEQHLESYRHERPAGVGGLNKQSDASAWDGSTNPSRSTGAPTTAGPASSAGSAAKSRTADSSATSDLLSNREKTPHAHPDQAHRRHRGVAHDAHVADARARGAAGRHPQGLLQGRPRARPHPRRGPPPAGPRPRRRRPPRLQLPARRRPPRRHAQPRTRRSTAASIPASSLVGRRHRRDDGAPRPGARGPTAPAAPPGLAVTELGTKSVPPRHPRPVLPPSAPPPPPPPPPTLPLRPTTTGRRRTRGFRR